MYNKYFVVVKCHSLNVGLTEENDCFVDPHPQERLFMNSRCSCTLWDSAQEFTKNDDFLALTMW
mgnify:FL=1